MDQHRRQVTERLHATMTHFDCTINLISGDIPSHRLCRLLTAATMVPALLRCPLRQSSQPHTGLPPSMASTFHRRTSRRLLESSSDAPPGPPPCARAWVSRHVEQPESLSSRVIWRTVTLGVHWNYSGKQLTVGQRRWSCHVGSKLSANKHIASIRCEHQS